MLSSRRNLTLACALSTLAGYVDGIGFLHLGGMFVSFMSGNSTRLGVDLAIGDWPKAAEAASLIALFVVGAATGSLIVSSRKVRSSGQGWVLFSEALLLAAAALCYTLGFSSLAIAAMVLAMGQENAVFQFQGGGGLTYVTGALVKVGQLIAAALTGGPRWAWLPNLLQWAGLVAGAVCGALAYRWINLAALWFAAAVAVVLSGIAFATAK
jgi:uncharacterized membrane protein YoaK (UPF0700 family)